jgi:hypothetical protein
MAARLRQTHQEEVKEKIQTSQLINRLNNHIDGTIELSTSQIDAIKFLVNKRLSNAPTITENETSLVGEIAVVDKRPKLTREEWLESLKQ